MKLRTLSPFLRAAVCSLLIAQAGTGQSKTPAAKLTLSPISIDAIAPDDPTVTGFSPVPNVALSIKINGTPGVSSANANASGKFVVALPQKAETGNFVEVSGKAPNGTALYGSATVSAASSASASASAAPSLSPPTIGVAHDGDTSIKLTANAADASQAGLSMHVKVMASARSATPIWEGDCTPSPATAPCTLTPNPPALTAGQTLVATDQVAAGGSLNSSKPSTLNVAAAQGLASATVSGAEGTPFAFVTPDKSDAGKNGLHIDVAIVDKSGMQVDKGTCTPDPAGDKCQVNLSKILEGPWRIQATEKLGNASGPVVTADVTPLAALGKPSIAAPHDGDKTISVTLNSNDVSNVKPPTRLKIAVVLLKPDGSAVTNAPLPCIPNDTTNQCQVTPAAPLTEGQVVKAWEFIAGLTSPPTAPRPADGVAVATVVNDALATPTVSKVTESATSATVRVNDADLKKWPGALSVAVDVYDGDNPIPGQSSTCTLPGATPNSCSVTFAALVAGQTVHAREIPNASATTAPSAPGPDSIAEVQEQGYNWGRVRAYFSLGTVFSRNTITTPASTSTTSGATTPSTTSSDFTSPDAFAAFDMDFNWFTTQACLAASYVSKPAKLATLADAAAQCEWSVARKKFGHSAAPPPTQAQKFQNEQNGLLIAMQAATDPGVVATLSLLSRFYASLGATPDLETQETTGRLGPILKRFKVCPETDTTCQDQIKASLRQLASLEFTPSEARRILSSNNGFEVRNRHGFLVNSYFTSKLTQTAASNGFALTSSPNSFHVEGGIYAPFYFAWSRWNYQHKPYALFVAPIAKLGFDSLRGSATDQLTLASTSTSPTAGQTNFSNAATALSKDIYRSVSAGGRIGFLALSPTPNRAPSLISYVDFTYGRFDNYFTQKYGDTTGAVRYPLRFEMTGLFKVPSTPMYIGMDLNKGVGPDNLTLFVGLRTDLSSLLSKLVTVPTQ